jgi:hypothetical protein
MIKNSYFPSIIYVNDIMLITAVYFKHSLISMDQTHNE